MFQKLLDERGATAYQVSKATGISTGSLTDWKKGRSSPNIENLQKIADYFGVTIDYFYGKVEQKKENPPAVNTVEELIAKEAADLSQADRQTVLDYIRFLKSKQ